MNKRRASLDPENVELLFFLRCNWTDADEWHAIGRTARLDAWPFLLLCVGVSLELARCCLANNALNGSLFSPSESTLCCSRGYIEKLPRLRLYASVFCENALSFV